MNQAPVTGYPPQTTLDVYNVETEPSALLLAAPQHTNFKAYCIIKDSVYPFSAPYNRGVDEIRILLNYLGTSYSAVLDTFRDAYISPTLPPQQIVKCRSYTLPFATGLLSQNTWD